MSDLPAPIPDESQHFSDAQLADLNARFDRTTSSEIVKWSAEMFGRGLLMTSSFGADSMCLIHLATQVMPDIRIVLVNTGYLFPETISFMEEMRSQHGLNVREYHTHNDPIVWLTVHGESDPRVRNDVDACCAANKNVVMDRAMKDLAPGGWLRGVRADQSAERSRMSTVQWSQRNNCWAIAPMLRWSPRDVFQYMKKHQLPHHPLWEQGYTSIGCNPATCTRAIGAGDDDRAGRWAGTNKKECGIHLDLGSAI